MKFSTINDYIIVLDKISQNKPSSSFLQPKNMHSLFKGTILVGNAELNPGTVIYFGKDHFSIDYEGHEVRVMKISNVIGVFEDDEAKE